MQLLRRAYQRFAHLVHEMLKFGTIGALAFIIDFGGTNLLYAGVGLGPNTSKVLATVVAATFAYLGNRFWTFRHREQTGVARSYTVFFMLNGIGLLISMLIISFVHYGLHRQDLLSYNIAQFIGLVLGTLFRFWSYKKWVFLAPDLPPLEPEGAKAGPVNSR